MSEDEVLALILSAVFGFIGTVGWYRPLLTVTLLGGGLLLRVALFLVPLPGLAVLWWMLTTYGAKEVRQGPEYIFLFMLAGTASEPQADLAHTLRRWQEAGIGIERKVLSTDGPPVPLVVNRPSGFRSLWHRLLVASGLRRNPLGGFGGMLAEASAG